MDNSINLFGKNSKVFNKKFVLSSGVSLVIFGKDSERERFVILELKDFFKLTNPLLKNKKIIEK